jgi:hypothetical protein
MKKALISPLENNRIVEFSSDIFPVAEPLFWVSCPEQVSTEWKFNEGVFEPPFLIPPETLEESKVAQKSLINFARDTEESNGFEYLGKILDSDERSALRITMASLTAQLSIDIGQPFSIDWTCKDNSMLTLDGQQTIEMPKALAIHGLTLHGKAKYLKSLIDSATTLEEVKAIQW